MYFLYFSLGPGDFDGSLEKESGLFFNLNYFENIVMNGELEDAEKYLRGFTRVEENRYSMKMFFEIRKQRYLEALDM